jgi:hypothetical protein
MNQAAERVDVMAAHLVVKMAYTLVYLWAELKVYYMVDSWDHVLAE